MAKVEITDGQAAVKVEENKLHTFVAPYPPLEPTKIRPFRQYFTSDGTSTGSFDMGIDGSSTNVEFYVEATDTADRYITNISIILGYGTAGFPYEFADGTALTNGVHFHYLNQQGDTPIHDAIKTNQDFFRLSHEPVRDGWELRGIGAANDYGYFLTLDLENYMPPFGVKLDKDSAQRLGFIIRDNLSTVADDFNAIAYGFERFE
jgi:hypothetical protein